MEEAFETRSTFNLRLDSLYPPGLRPGSSSMFGVTNGNNLGRFALLSPSSFASEKATSIETPFFFF